MDPNVTFQLKKVQSKTIWQIIINRKKNRFINNRFNRFISVDDKNYRIQ